MEEDSLPENFAHDLIELESHLEQSCSMELIQKLNQLYMMAIDYYIRQQPRKAMHFQKKMISLLSDPKTLIAIEEPHEKSSLEVQQQRLKNQSINAQRKIKEQMNKFNIFSDQYVKSMLENSEKVIRKAQQLKNVDLNKQQKNLEQRILLKKVRSQSKLQKLQSPTNQKQNITT